MTDPTVKPSAPPRRWTKRLLAVGIGILLLAAIELCCRAFGLGADTDRGDPWVGFTGTRPLFEVTEDGRRMRIANNRRQFFADDSFHVKKAPNGFRVFALGGSTVQGRPFSVATSLTEFLELALHHSDPSREWEVVNCGGISYASYRLIPILEECLTYEPDLIVLCTGHNEFLEDVSYGELRDSADRLGAIHELAENAQSFRWLRSILKPNATSDDTSSVPLLPEEVDARLDHIGGLAAYHRDRSQRERVAAAFGNNLRQMISSASERGVPVIVVEPPAELLNQPPFKYESSDGLNTRDATAVAAVLNASGLLSARSAESENALRDATTRDPENALAWYLLGRYLHEFGDRSQADEALLRAMDEDICPLRMTRPLRKTMHEVVDDTGVPFINAHQLLTDQTGNHGLPPQLLVDHIHPSFKGHQLIALAILDEMRRMNLITSEDHGAEEYDAVFRNHMNSLDDLYFLRGRRTLEALRNWTKGNLGPQFRNE